MNKKTFGSLTEMNAFVAPLIAEDKWFMVIKKGINSSGKEEFTVEWREHLRYMAQDGRSYADEIWVTKDGVPYFVQELEVEHLRNVLRKFLREERENVEFGQYVSDIADEAAGLVAAVMDQKLDDIDAQVDALFPENMRTKKDN
jgi:hypothetical protein